MTAHTEIVVSPTRPGTSLWGMLRALPPSARWMTCLALLVPSLATLVVLRTPILSTAPRDPAQDVAVVGTARPVENPPTPLRGPRPSALTSPPPQAGAHVAQSASPTPRPNSAAVRSVALARSADPVAVTVRVPDDKAATRVTAGPSRKTSSDRLPYRGTISVESQPAGGQVSVDGQSVGVTPLVGWELPAGSHVVRIDLDGYERWSTSIQVVTEKTLNVATNLRPTRHD